VSGIDPGAAAVPEVRAAGGAVWRRGVDGAGPLEVVVVHRPRYDDWTLPKGKVEVGESDQDAARREVAEEAGVVCALGAELPPTRYTDRRGRDKQVRWWAMTILDGEVGADNEVDGAEWLPLPAARDRLTYPRDLPLLDALDAAVGPPPGEGAGPGGLPVSA